MRYWSDKLDEWAPVDRRYTRARVETIDRMSLLPGATAENGGQDAAGGNGGNTCTETCGGKHPRPQAPIAKTMIRSTNMPHLKQ